MISTFAESTHGQPLLLKTETFDAEPGWDGRNNRASDPAPRQIVQNFGFNSSSSNAGGAAGEIGGFITPAGEPAFYGKVITPTSFNDSLSASGILNVPQGGGHTLIGFFNADTANEWRTPNDLTYTIGFMPPRLTVAQTAPAEAFLEWPTNSTDFMLESAPDLDAGSLWSPITNVVAVNAAVFRVSVSTTNAARFFRLRKP